MPINLLADEMPVQKKAPINLLEDEMPQEKESFGSSLKSAPGKVLKDLGDMIFEKIQSMPGYIEKGKTEIPALPGMVGNQLLAANFPLFVGNERQNRAQSAAKQEFAGLNELVNKFAQVPLSAAKYGANRLNLLPQSVPNAIGAITPEDTTQSINQLFGQSKYPGESLGRGIARNLDVIAPTAKGAAVFNPMKLTTGNIAKEIINAGEKNKNIYGGMYKNLWKDAENKGFSDALYDVDIDMNTLKKFSPKKSINGVLEFDKNPTLENAHTAKSDLLRIQRDLNQLPTLRSAERKQLKAVNDAIDNIQSNMFKSKQGIVDKNMLDRYNTIQQGYANDVVPYKNRAINQFKAKKINSDELIRSLSKGEFNAKKGGEHKALGFRKMISNHPIISGSLGLGGAGGLAALLYKMFSGENPQ